MNTIINLLIAWFEKRDRGNIVLFFLCVLVLSTVLTLIWVQVFNHIPTQIKEVKQEIKTVEIELKQEIKEVKQEIKELQKDNTEIKQSLTRIEGALFGINKK